MEKRYRDSARIKESDYLRHLHIENDLTSQKSWYLLLHSSYSSTVIMEDGRPGCRSVNNCGERIAAAGNEDPFEHLS